jgi:hypothetical protein
MWSEELLRDNIKIPNHLNCDKVIQLDSLELRDDTYRRTGDLLEISCGDVNTDIILDDWSDNYLGLINLITKRRFDVILSRFGFRMINVNNPNAEVLLRIENNIIQRAEFIH